MPRQLKEIRNFNSGIIFNASETDISADAASFSLNINPMAEDGVLDSIYNNKITAFTGRESIIEFTEPLAFNDAYTIMPAKLYIKDISVLDNQAVVEMKYLGIKGITETLSIYDIFGFAIASIGVFIATRENK